MGAAAADAAAGEGGSAQTNPPVQVSVGDVVITGEQFETDPTTGLITVSGNPRAVRGQDEIRATRMVINPRTLQFTAEGDVIIRQGGRELRGTRATYNFEQQGGQVEKAKTVSGPYFIQAEQILIKPGGTYEARRSRYSTCDRDHPHWSIYSRVVDVVPDERLTAYNAGLDLLGMRLFTVPRASKPLGQEEADERDRIPSFGYSSFNGPYVRQEFNLVRNGPVWVDADVQLNTFHEPSGGFRLGSAGRLKYVASAFYRDVAPNQRTAHLQVSRLPEVGVIWSNNDRFQPGRFLGDRVQNVRYDRALDVSKSWIFAAQATVGFFRQHRGENVPDPDAASKNGGRAMVQAQAVLPLVDLGFFHLNDLRLFARQSFYDNGDKFLTYGTGIGKKVRTGNFTFSLNRFDSFSSGSTPFYFDDLDLRHEWRPAFEYSTRGFELSYYTRINAETYHFFDHVISVSKLLHCIKPTLTYRVRRSEIFFEIRIPGLGGSPSTKAGESRSEQGTGDSVPGRSMESQPK
jgi:lipopolysaccharide export system protein LptA